MGKGIGWEAKGNEGTGKEGRGREGKGREGKGGGKVKGKGRGGEEGRRCPPPNADSWIRPCAVISDIHFLSAFIANTMSGKKDLQ